jgi:hypothetical protein
MSLPDAPIAHEGFFATHFFTVSDQEKSKDFYVPILGGKAIKPDNPCYIKLANTWILLNSGGGPTRDKPEVVLGTPWDLKRVSSFLNLRVADIWACYKRWGDNGASFLTEPVTDPDRVPDNPDDGRTGAGVSPPSIVRQRICGQRRPTLQAVTLFALSRSNHGNFQHFGPSGITGPMRAFTIVNALRCA